MGFTSEIYLMKKHVAEEEWLKFIKAISNYNGMFRSWKLLIVNNKNKIRYLVKTECNLPITINNQSAFLIKKFKNVKLPNCVISYPFITKKKTNVIGLINHCEVKNKGKVK